MYDADALFYSEFTIYHNCLRYMGYDRSPEQSSRYYLTGFTQTFNITIDSDAYTSAVSSGPTTSECPNARMGTENETWFPAGKTVGNALVGFNSITKSGANQSALGWQTVTSMTSRAGAAGMIHKNYAAVTNRSYMTINEYKVISIKQNGF